MPAERFIYAAREANSAGRDLTLVMTPIRGKSDAIGAISLESRGTERLALGADHRLVLPASFITGAAFTVAADLVARIAIAPAELPVGAITALCGGPFFIYVLRHEGRKSLAL